MLSDSIVLEYNEKAEHERTLTPELEQVLIIIAKTGYSKYIEPMEDVICDCSCFHVFVCRYPWEKIKPLLLQKLMLVVDQFNVESNMDKLDVHPNIDRITFEELKSDIIERINSFEK